jgi:hypothetical protein
VGRLHPGLLSIDVEPGRSTVADEVNVLLPFLRLPVAVAEPRM